MESDVSEQKTGFIRCQIQISDLVIAHHRELSKKLTALRAEIESMKSLLERQKKIHEYNKISRQLDVLSWISDQIYSLSPGRCALENRE